MATTTSHHPLLRALNDERAQRARIDADCADLYADLRRAVESADRGATRAALVALKDRANADDAWWYGRAIGNIDRTWRRRHPVEALNWTILRRVGWGGADLERIRSTANV